MTPEGSRKSWPVAPQGQYSRTWEDFCPWFSHRSFELKCPELDDSMLRRLRMEHSREKAAMETKEKSLLLNQKKFLDIGNPIIEV